MSYNFRNITPARIGAADKKPGHSDLVLFAPHGSAVEATGWAVAVASAAAGSSKSIATDHTFPSGAGFFSLQCKANSLEATGDAAGEAGGQVPKYKMKCIIKGDDAVINEFVENVLNEDGVWLFNDPTCGVDNYVQLGSRCTPANIEGFAYRGGSKGAGGFKEYEFTVTCTDKFFYSGTVTMADNIDLDAIPSLVFSAVGSAGFVVAANAAVAGADNYVFQRSTTIAFTSPTTISGTGINRTLTGLAANTTYYVRGRATASSGVVLGPWTVGVVTTDV